jgi:hypothetical protein
VINIRRTEKSEGFFLVINASRRLCREGPEEYKRGTKHSMQMNHRV